MSIVQGSIIVPLINQPDLHIVEINLSIMRACSHVKVHSNSAFVVVENVLL